MPAQEAPEARADTGSCLRKRSKEERSLLFPSERRQVDADAFEPHDDC
jgi:hypothetical protein